MRIVKMILLIANTLACVAAGIDGAIKFHNLFAHPLATEGDPWRAWFYYKTPCLLMIGAGVLAFGRAWLLALITLVGMFVAFIVSSACSFDVKTSLFILDGRAAGGHPMHCFPPAEFFVLPVAYWTSFISGVVALALRPRHGQAIE